MSHHAHAALDLARPLTHHLTPTRSIALLLLSPVLVLLAAMSAPLVLASVPLLIVAYVAHQFLGPLGKIGKMQRSTEVGDAPSTDAKHKGGKARRSLTNAKALIANRDGHTTIPALMQATIEKFGTYNATQRARQWRMARGTGKRGRTRSIEGASH
jgi:hypothetical protein